MKCCDKYEAIVITIIDLCMLVSLGQAKSFHLYYARAHTQSIVELELPSYSGNCQRAPRGLRSPIIYANR
jgi:hypothetical protein